MNIKIVISLVILLSLISIVQGAHEVTGITKTYSLNEVGPYEVGGIDFEINKDMDNVTIYVKYGSTRYKAYNTITHNYITCLEGNFEYKNVNNIFEYKNDKYTGKWIKKPVHQNKNWHTVNDQTAYYNSSSYITAHYLGGKPIERIEINLKENKVFEGTYRFGSIVYDNTNYRPIYKTNRPKYRMWIQ